MSWDWGMFLIGVGCAWLLDLVALFFFTKRYRFLVVPKRRQ